MLSVCLSVPLGAAAVGRSRTTAGNALAGLCSAFVLVTVLTVFEPALWFRALVWCGAGTLLGAGIGGQHRALGIVAGFAWLALCGLPFFAGSVPVFRETAAIWAHGGCPWLGFSQDALGGDPLRRQVLYLGQLSVLTDEPAYGLLNAGTLWVAAALAVATLAARNGARDAASRRASAPAGEKVVGATGLEPQNSPADCFDRAAARPKPAE